MQIWKSDIMETRPYAKQFYFLRHKSVKTWPQDVNSQPEHPTSLWENKIKKLDQFCTNSQTDIRWQSKTRGKGKTFLTPPLPPCAPSMMACKNPTFQRSAYQYILNYLLLLTNYNCHITKSIDIGLELDFSEFNLLEFYEKIYKRSTRILWKKQKIY